LIACADLLPEDQRLTVRRRSRKRPLTDFASRSPLHAVIAFGIRLGLLAAISIFGYVVIVNVLAPNLVDVLIRHAPSR
jgi:hypothetical protein